MIKELELIVKGLNDPIYLEYLKSSFEAGKIVGKMYFDGIKESWPILTTLTTIAGISSFFYFNNERKKYLDSKVDKLEYK
jgi:hypothetical protein